jgi:hypothetical protein
MNDLKEKLSLALKTCETSNESKNLHVLIDDIQQVWKSLDLDMDSRSLLLNQIASSNHSCALKIYENCKQEQNELKMKIQTEENHLRNIEKFTGLSLSKELSKDFLSLKHQWNNIEVIKDSITTPKLEEMTNRVQLLQKNARALSANLNSYETFELESLQELLNLNVDTIFDINSNDDDDENFMMKCIKGNVKLQMKCDTWEKENRSIALKLANVQSNLHLCLENASKQLFDMDMNEFNEISRLGKQIFLNDKVSIEIQNKVCHQLLTQDAPICAGDHDYVIILRKVIRVIDQHYIARNQVSENAIKLLETWFETAYENSMKQSSSSSSSSAGTGTSSVISRPLSRKSISKLIQLIDTLLDKSKQSCEGFVTKMNQYWDDNNVSLEKRTVIPQEWLKRTSKYPALKFKLAIDQVILPQVLSSSASNDAKTQYPFIDNDFLNKLNIKIDEGFIEASDYNDCAGVVQPLLHKMETKENLEKEIFDIDTQLNNMQRDALKFEQKDPKRLTDRSGKGRLDLKNEELQRKQFQKDTRFLLSELNRTVNMWESNEEMNFDYSKLSEHGQDIFAKKKPRSSSLSSSSSKSMPSNSERSSLSSIDVISQKTSLMHLEAGIQVSSNARRSSKESMMKDASTKDTAEGNEKSATSNILEVAHEVKASSSLTSSSSIGGSSILSTPMADKTNKVSSLLSKGASTVKRNPFVRVTNSNKLRASIQKPSYSENNLALSPTTTTTSSNSTNNPLTSMTKTPVSMTPVNSENLQPR